MYNWAEICSELKDLEKRVDAKIDTIISENANSFPHARITKARQIETLSRALRQFIEMEQEKDATVTFAQWFVKTQTTAGWHEFEDFEETDEVVTDNREIGEFLEGVEKGESI